MDDEKYLKELTPTYQVRFRKFIEFVHAAGYGKIRITQGYRSRDEQARLYGKGRSALQLRLKGINPAYAKPKEAIVTSVTRSKHTERKAIDVSIQCYPKEHWEAIGKCGERCGLTWGGRWKKLRDYCHFEV